MQRLYHGTTIRVHKRCNISNGFISLPQTALEDIKTTKVKKKEEKKNRKINALPTCLSVENAIDRKR